MTSLRRRNAIKDEENPPCLTSADSDDDISYDEEKERESFVAKLFVLDARKLVDLDKFLDRYSTFSYSTYTADLGLKLLQWTSWAISYEFDSDGMHQLFYELSMTRYVLRFYGFFQSLEGYRSGSWAGSGWDDPLIDFVAKYLLAGSMLFFYPLEHIAYAGWKLPDLVKVNAHMFSVASCGFWLVYTLADIWICFLKWKELRKKLHNLVMRLDKKKRSGDMEAVTELLEEEQSLLDKLPYIRLEVMRCFFWTLPAAHWSMSDYQSNPLLSEQWLHGLMLAEACTHLYQSIE